MGRANRWSLLAVLALAIPLAFAGEAWAGPVQIWGIDAEDGGAGIFGHGVISDYTGAIGAVAGAASKGAGLMVIGGGASGSDVRAWWDAVALGIGLGPVTYVTTASGIALADFSGVKLLAIASTINQTGSGGLTDAEAAAITARSGAVAAHVNADGGLIVMTQAGSPSGYGMVGGVGAITSAGGGTFGNLYDDITATAAGTALGIDDSLDIFAWHDVFTGFPGFLKVLATNADSLPLGTEIPLGLAAVIGGEDVVVGTVPVPFPASVLLLGAGLIGLGTVARVRARRK